MKRHFIFMVASLATLFVSCVKETTDVTVTGETKTVTITASADAVSKVTFNDCKFSWVKGDQISVMGDDYNFYTFTANSTGATTTFTGQIPAKVEIGDYAYYPASDKHYVEGSQPYFYVAESKDLTGAFSADLPMIAENNGDGTLHFKHSSSGLLFTFEGLPDEFKSAEITFVTSNAKFSGHYKVINDVLSWNTVESAQTELEKTYSRKVSVVDNTVQLYVPYHGTLWNGWTYNVNVVGYDADNKGTVLFDNVSMKGRDLKLKNKGEIVPVAPLKYAPEPDFDNVDWEAAATATVEPTAAYSRLKELKAVADKYYMYVRLTASFVAPYDGDYLDIFLADGAGENSVWDGWTTKGTNVYKCGLDSHIGKVNKDTGEVSRMYLKEADDTQTNVVYRSDVSGEEACWYFAYPRESVDAYASAGKVYVSYMLWNAWAPYGVIPSYGSPMLEVTLP